MATQTSQASSWRVAYPQLQRIADRVNTTPGILRLGLGGVCLLAALLSFTVWQGTKQHLKAIKTVEEDSAPSIVAGQGIKAGLADMHSNVANDLLAAPTGPARFAISGGIARDVPSQAVQDYWKRYKEVVGHLKDAAKNITYPDENQPVFDLLNTLGQYQEMIGKARALHQQGDPSFLAAHRQADELMRKVLLPAADRLTEVNQRELDRGYQEEQTAGTWAAGRVWLAAIALLALLGGLQYFLFRRMRRVFNPALLAATLMVLAFSIWTLISFHDASTNLKGAKQDAFDSMGVLERARADAYDANGEESRWLLEYRTPQQANCYEKAFNEKADRVATRPTTLTDDALLKDFKQQTNNVPPGLEGYLAAELRNITFPGEKDAALEALRQFLDYRRLDARIRQLEHDGQHAEAVALCVGNEKGQSNWVFEQFVQALQKTIEINQNYFTANLSQAKHGLTGLEWFGPLTAALAVAVLTLAGLWPRLREYSLN